MSKALVIKGASFAANKVETITLTQPIPCTGLSVSPTTVSFTALNTTQQLTVTKTPADTTDTISYASSNENVATVSNSGLITCVGVGSATITVMCGEQSAEVTLTAIHSIVLDDVYSVLNGMIYAETLSLSATPPKDYISYSGSTKGRLYYSNKNTLQGYKAFAMAASVTDEMFAIPLPKGATKVSFDPPTGMRNRGFFVLLNSHEKQTYVNGVNAALGIQHYLRNNIATYPSEIDFANYASAADSFIVSVQSPSEPAESVTGKTTLVFT